MTRSSTRYSWIRLLTCSIPSRPKSLPSCSERWKKTFHIKTADNFYCLFHEGLVYFNVPRRKLTITHCYGTVTIYYGSGCGFWQVTVPAPSLDHKKKFKKTFSKKNLAFLMFIEAAMFPRNLSSVSVRNFAIPFYCYSGSAKAKVKDPTVRVPQHCYYSIHWVSL